MGYIWWKYITRKDHIGKYIIISYDISLEREDAMKKIYILFCMIVVTIIISYCLNRQVHQTSNNQVANIKVNQEYPNKKTIIDNLTIETKIDKDKIIQKNLWIQYIDMDEDPELELLVSYRVDIHKGYFFIYDYMDRKYLRIFSKEWAIERMSGNDVIAASGNDQVHQLTAYIIHMYQGKVNVLWNGIIDKYEYTNQSKGREIHAHYYVDTNSILHYCYKVEVTDMNAEVLKREYKEDLYSWSNIENKYIKSNNIYKNIN